jgi:hypothetical protein
MIAVLLFTIGALTTAGCGGSSGKATPTGTTATAVTSSSSTTTPLTRSELIAKADAICYRVNVERSANRIRSIKSIATTIPHLVAYEQAAFTELGHLVPPTSMSSDWKVIVSSANALASDTKKVGEEVQTGNSSAAGQSLSASNLDLQKMLSVAQRNGFKDCAQIS